MPAGQAVDSGGAGGGGDVRGRAGEQHDGAWARGGQKCQFT